MQYSWKRFRKKSVDR